MSANCGLVASSLAVALLVGLAPAQEKIKAAEQLRKENAELRKENATLKQKLKALDTRAKKEGKQRQRDVLRDVPEIVKREARKARDLEAKRRKEGRRRAVEIRIQIKAQEVLLARALGDAMVQQSPPIPDKDFLKALDALTQARRKLGQVKEPAKAKAVVDEMERILGDARRALWKLEQAEKQKKTKTPTKK